MKRIEGRREREEIIGSSKFSLAQEDAKTVRREIGVGNGYTGT